MRKIAVILTCFNRKDKTLSCLEHMFTALDYYNSSAEEHLSLSIYITDDCCTDGTAEAVKTKFSGKDINIQKSEGNLFWARGMNFSWKVAAEQHWDYFLLLNDDTDMTKDCFVQLFEAENFSLSHHSKEALVSGIIASKDNHAEVTYGGERFLTRFTSKFQLMQPSGCPQQCDLTNANILLVPYALFQKIGFFYPYQHSCADSDYSHQAKHAGFPVYVTSAISGYCDFDHWTVADDRKQIVLMTLAQRKAYFSHPLHSNKDYLTLIWRMTPWRYPFVWIFRNMVVYMPKLYYKLTYRRYE